MTATSPQLNKPLRSEREAALDRLIERAREAAQRHQYGPVGDAAHYSAVSTRLWRRVEALQAAKNGQGLTAGQLRALGSWLDDLYGYLNSLCPKTKGSREQALATIDLIEAVRAPLAAAAE